MIRIHLLDRRESRVIAFLVRVFLVVGSGALLVVAVYLADRQFPILRLWGELTAFSVSNPSGDGTAEPAVSSQSESTRAGEPGDEQAPPVRRPRRRVATTVRPATAPARTAPVRALSAPVASATPELRPLPRASQACTLVLGLLRHLPEHTRLTSVMGRGDGSYTIEGSGISKTEAGALQEGLEERSSDVRFTVWPQRKGNKDRGLRFSCTGKVMLPASATLTPLDSTASASLLREISSWARASGMRSLTVEGPIPVALNEDLSKHRQKIWGKGSHGQITTFADRLVEAGQRAVLSELVVVPVYRDGRQWQNAHLYAAVDVLVR